MKFLMPSDQLKSPGHFFGTFFARGRVLTPESWQCPSSGNYILPLKIPHVVSAGFKILYYFPSSLDHVQCCCGLLNACCVLLQRWLHFSAE